MPKGYLHHIQERLWRKAEDVFYSDRVKHSGDGIALLKLDKIGDYILFRNFIEETYKHFNGKRKLVFCGNVAVKEFAEKLDKEYVTEFIWVDVPKLFNYSYRFKIYKQLRKAGCNTLINCAYSRTAESDKIAYYSGAKEVIGFAGDDINMHPSHKQAGDSKYTKLVPSGEKCLFEFYRNRELFNHILGKEVKIEAPNIKAPALPEKEKNKHILIFPGAGEEIRKWNIPNYKQLSKELTEIYQLPVVICGPANEKDMGDQIVAGNQDKVVNTMGKYSLEETLEAIQSAKFVVSGDTGAMHIALALSIPVVCISNGNFYQRFCPYPQAMNKPLTVVYPDGFEKLVQNNLDSVRCIGSNTDVNVIGVSKVMAAIKNNIKL